MVMDPLFRIPPTRYKAKDGSGRVMVVEHRVGQAVIAYTKAQLMRKIGLEKEYRDLMKSFQSRITKADDLKELADSLWTTQSGKLKTIQSNYRKFLRDFYTPQGGTVRFGGVPLDESGTLGYFIQAIVDQKTRALLVGEADDLALWNEVTAIREKSHRDLYDDAVLSAKAMLKLPNLNKDLQNRMKLLIAEELPSSINMIGMTAKTEPK